MPADLRLVPHAAEGHSHELPAERARDRLAERGLAHAGRSDEAEDRSLQFSRELEHGDVLDDPLLDLLQAVVVLVENALHFLDVDIVVGRDAPGERDQPVDVVPHDGGFGRHEGHLLELVELLHGLVVHVLRHPRLLDLLGELLDLVRELVLVAQLLANRLELLVEVELLLVLVDLAPDLPLDLPLQFQDFELARERAAEQAEALDQVVLLEDLLLHPHLQNEVGGDRVGEEQGIRDVVRGREDLVRDAAVQVDVVVERREHVPDQGLQLRLWLDLVVEHRDGGRHGVAVLGELLHLSAADALDQDAHRPVREPEELEHADHGSDPVEILRGGIRDLGPLLGEHEHNSVLLDRRLDGVHRSDPAHEERDGHVGIDDDVAKWKERDALPDFEDFAVAFDARHALTPPCVGDPPGGRGSGGPSSR
jgi:hypothetical protein